MFCRMMSKIWRFRFWHIGLSSAPKRACANQAPTESFKILFTVCRCRAEVFKCLYQMQAQIKNQNDNSICHCDEAPCCYQCGNLLLGEEIASPSRARSNIPY